MNGSMFLGPLKHFIKSSGDNTQCTNDYKCTQEQSKSRKETNVSGSEVTHFYRSTVGKEAFKLNAQISKPKNTNHLKKRNATVNKVFSVNKFMKAVENNDLKVVNLILENNKEHINSTDQYGWSPIMSASCAGNKQMVELLLQWKPNLDLKDKSGNSCKTIAKAKKHSEIVQILDSYADKSNSLPSSKCSQSLQDPSETTYIFCKMCKQNIENTSYKKHIVSLLHNFNSQRKRQVPTMYGIPESNKGFQMLMRSGWNKEKGLGPSGDGHKFPPKSVLKQDRTGLGAKQYKARVTHTPEDLRREAKPKNTFKKQLTTSKQKERRQERNIRRMLT